MMSRTRSKARGKDTKSGPQLAMPGMAQNRPEPRVHVLSCCNVTPGQEVTYLGKIQGGPRYGTRGVVRQTLRQRAVVDMGENGTWKIPYYFLGFPESQAA